MEVTVTVWGDELPAEILSEGELSEMPKSALEVTVSWKEVVWAPDEPVPLIVIVLVPTEALGSTLTVRLAEAVPPDGTEIGFGLNVENVTPVGTDPVTDNVTGPEKPSSEVPVKVILPDPP
jgi:hypothetical protein